MFRCFAFGNHIFVCGKGSYPNKTIATIFFQTITLNSWFQAVSSQQSFITFFEGNFGVALRNWQNTCYNRSLKLMFLSFNNI